MTAGVGHLLRRAFGSLSNRGPDDESLAVVASVLSAGEFALWRRMPGRDQRHSIVVLRRFDEFLPAATSPERAAALLHDVGKTVSSLGWTMRVIATLAGPLGRRFSARFREYHEHEEIGARMLAAVSDERTVVLVGGLASDAVAAALRRADDV